MAKSPLVLLLLALVFLPRRAQASKLVSCSPLDRDFLMLSLKDGDVEFKDDAKGDKAHGGHDFTPGENWVVPYGAPLDTEVAAKAGSWKISSPDDPAYKGGLAPAAVYRRSKITGLAQMNWNDAKHDYDYEAPMEHDLFLKLPKPLQQGKHYSLALDKKINAGTTKLDLVFDVKSSRSEALHINLVGYEDKPGVKAADLYMFLGDGGYRDYAPFMGKAVSLLDVHSGQSTPVGKVTFGQKSAEEASKHNLTGGDVWHADFTGFQTPGTYRLVVEDLGCSPDFTIARDIYKEPYGVSVKGFFYMRIGQDNLDMVPVPRRPLWIQDKDPKDCKIIITTMQPFHEQWKTFTHGDQWDRPKDWAQFAKPGNPTNPKAMGGHSDALDWDRHLGHVSIIYDMLLPYILTRGALNEDNLGIAESGNGIPDLLDEARNEVDYWLSLRDGKGYSHGLTNPDGKHILYQAGCSPIAAWANALNCAMMAEAFRILGRKDLTDHYRDAALEAYGVASKDKDPMLDAKYGVGVSTVRGRDLKMMAAAYLFNVTGDTKFEKAMKEECVVTGPASEIDVDEQYSQTWGVAAYLTTDRPVAFPKLREDMKAALIREAKLKEADFTKTRPSRRSSDDKTGWFQTVQQVQRTIVAHSVALGPEKDQLWDALILEADWGLGRNPINTIQMTTATTALAVHRSVENIYTSGRDDGTPGLHPGHTPYLNIGDWGGGMIMGRPSWMAALCYPDFKTWPHAAGYFNARWVYAHSEFTPQQTMRGKMALYGYLYGVRKKAS